VKELNVKDTSVYTMNVSGLAPGLYLIKIENLTGAQKILIT
jgi:hypothetical protein